LRLHERILVLDRMIAADAVAVTGNENPVASQINQLARALSAG
jgi:hypothetical protein